MQGGPRQVSFYRHGEHKVWGATARVLGQVAALLDPSGGQPPVFPGAAGETGPTTPRAGRRLGRRASRPAARPDGASPGGTCRVRARVLRATVANRTLTLLLRCSDMPLAIV